jgi:MFS transporter, PAT family, beta-lactamase induction signal transducer AmpG
MTRWQKLAWISVFYFAEGLPFGIAYDVWPVYFRQHGVSLRDIGLMSVLFLPYTLKAAWAPAVDRLGSRQIWVALCQLALAATTVVFLGLNPADTSWSLWAVLLAFTLLSATQDIAIDAYAVDLSTPTDAGSINGVRVAAYRVALVAAGGLMLVLAGAIGWGPTWWGLAALFVLLALVTFVSTRAPRERSVAGPTTTTREVARYRLGALALAAVCLALAWQNDWSGIWLAFAVISCALAVASFLDPSMLRWVLRREMAVVVLFILLYKVGDSTLGRMVRPFWVDRGMTEAEIGIVTSTMGTLLTVLGALAGGWFTDRKGIFAALLWCGVAQLVSNFGYVAVAALNLPRGDATLVGLTFGPFQAAIYLASVVESFTQGLGTAAFLAFLMTLCDKRHAASQFALLSATFALSRDVAGAFSGIGAEALGYAAYFTLTACLAIPALALLPWIRGRIRGAPQPAPQLQV